jgi:Ca2+-binding EF-hand superfamily protein
MNNPVKFLTLLALVAAIPAQAGNLADSNGDGQVTKGERAAVQQQKFDARDVDNNGVLSPEEFQPGKDPHDAAKKLSKFDTNRDGQISSDEFAR